jgi:hypothetical protein
LAKLLLVTASCSVEAFAPVIETYAKRLIMV